MPPTSRSTPLTLALVTQKLTPRPAYLTSCPPHLLLPSPSTCPPPQLYHSRDDSINITAHNKQLQQQLEEAQAAYEEVQGRLAAAHQAAADSAEAVAGGAREL